MRTLVGRVATLATAATLLAACGGGGDKGTGGNGSTTLAIAANGGTSFAAAAGTALSGDRPSVKVTDASNGTPKAGVSVTFAVTAGGGSLSGATQTTDANGVATVGGWTLGTTAGANSVRANVTGQASVSTNFTATGNPGAPTRLVWSTNPASILTAGASLGNLAVDVADQFGNRVGDATNAITVAFGANPAAATLGGTTAKAATAGRAAFGDLTITTKAANYSLAASSTGLTAATSTFFTVNSASAAAMVKTQGDNQNGIAGGSVAVRPSVTISDAFGNLVQGATVTFAVASGGGSVTGATQVTNQNGVATVGNWTLGSAGTNTLTATVAGVTAATFTATAAAAASAYNVDLRYVGTAPSTTIQSAFTNAASRWSQIITGDLPDVGTGTAAGPGSCGQANFPDTRNTTIDDVIIYAEIAAIDGAGGTLGSAGPCFSFQGKTVIGYMKFDVADMDAMANNGTLGEVIVHEMGHVIGIGTLWSSFLTQSSTSGSDTSWIRTTDVRYTGTAGNTAYFALGSGATGSGSPIENCGSGAPSSCGVGNWLGHWRETTFRNELMTGFISAPGNPLSRMTIGALQDLGYVVNSAAADAYSLPANALFSGPARASVRLAELPWTASVYEIDARGNILRRVR